MTNNDFGRKILKGYVDFSKRQENIKDFQLPNRLKKFWKIIL